MIDSFNGWIAFVAKCDNHGAESRFRYFSKSIPVSAEFGSWRTTESQCNSDGEVPNKTDEFIVHGWGLCRDNFRLSMSFSRYPADPRRGSDTRSLCTCPQGFRSSRWPQSSATTCEAAFFSRACKAASCFITCSDPASTVIFNNRDASVSRIIT